MDCDFCVFTHKAHGVKWQLLESFFNSSWRAPAGAAKPAQAPSGGGGPVRCCRWALHGSNYTWLWYPDDDLIFGPGQLDKFVSAVTASRFHVLQASLCAGSEIHHPSLAQRPGVVNAIVPVHTVELQVRAVEGPTHSDAGPAAGGGLPTRGAADAHGPRLLVELYPRTAAQGPDLWVWR